MKRLLIILLMLGFGFTIFAQGEINEQQKVFFRNERSFGVLLNSDGIGLSYRTAKRKDYLNKRIIEVDGGILKSPKEYRQRLVAGQGSAYIFGKLNSVFYLRGGYGHQHELYSKEDFGGIAIRYFYSAGPVFALYKPIYYKILYPIPGTQDLQVVEQKFDPNAIASPYEIYGRASFTKGFKETKVMPGLYAKAGFNFEYSKEDRAIHAIEIGGLVNAFPKEIPIMAVTKNKKFFFSMFVSYRFGMILDPLHPETNRFKNIFKRSKRDNTQQYDQYQYQQY